MFVPEFKIEFNFFLSFILTKLFEYFLQDPDDLPFKKGEILTVVSKDEEQWWTARNNTQPFLCVCDEMVYFMD